MSEYQQTEGKHDKILGITCDGLPFHPGEAAILLVAFTMKTEMTDNLCFKNAGSLTDLFSGSQLFFILFLHFQSSGANLLILFSLTKQNKKNALVELVWKTTCTILKEMR